MGWTWKAPSHRDQEFSLATRAPRALLCNQRLLREIGLPSHPMMTCRQSLAGEPTRRPQSNCRAYCAFSRVNMRCPPTGMKISVELTSALVRVRTNSFCRTSPVAKRMHRWQESCCPLPMNATSRTCRLAMHCSVVGRVYRRIFVWQTESLSWLVQVQRAQRIAAHKKIIAAGESRSGMSTNLP